MSPKKSIEISFVTAGSRGFSVFAHIPSKQNIGYSVYWEIHLSKRAILQDKNFQYITFKVIHFWKHYCVHVQCQTIVCGTFNCTYTFKIFVFDDDLPCIRSGQLMRAQVEQTKLSVKTFFLFGYFGYFWVLWVLLGIFLGILGVFKGTCGYFWVLLGTFKFIRQHFWVVLFNFGYF